MKQRTLKGEFTLQGKGLHTGLRINATMRPAPASTGYVFRRIDLEGQPTIDALAENVVDTRRGTVIASKSNREARVSTIEHALAALYAAGIDNCFIDVDAPELPILDGSAIRSIACDVADIFLTHDGAVSDCQVLDGS